MQKAASRPGQSQTQEQQSKRVRRKSRVSGLVGGGLLFAALLGVWLMFVIALEDFDFDTAFIALFCAMLSMFVIKAVAAGLAPRR